MQQSKNAIEDRATVRAELAAMTDLLVVEFAHSHSAETVRRCVSRTRASLLGTGVRDGLVPATEAAARMQLTRTVPTRVLIGS